MNFSWRAIFCVLLVVQTSTRFAEANPNVFRYEFMKGNTPFSASGGLTGSSGDYDLLGGFTLVVDEASGMASITNLNATLQGSPGDFSLVGLEVAPLLLGKYHSVEGEVQEDNSIVFERCTSNFLGDEIECFSFFDNTPETQLYPFAVRTKLVLERSENGKQVALSGSSAHIQLVLDGGSRRLSGAQAILVPEPSTCCLSLFAWLPVFVRAKRFRQQFS